MSPLEKRLKELKASLEAEKASASPSQKYIEDLKLTIKQCEENLKRNPSKGYEMVNI